MARNAPTPSNSISFSPENRGEWLGLILADKRFSQQDSLIAGVMSQNIEFQQGYGGWIMNSNYRYVVKKLQDARITIDKSDVASVLWLLVEHGYLSRFKLDKSGLYYFTDPTK